MQSGTLSLDPSAPRPPLETFHPRRARCTINRPTDASVGFCRTLPNPLHLPTQPPVPPEPLATSSLDPDPDAAPADPGKAARRRERILEAALDVFTRRGYGDAAMEEIASESETSKGGLYFHFPGKQALFGALLDRTADLLLSRLEAAAASERDPLRRADAAVERALDVFGSHRGLARLFLIDAHTRDFAPRLLGIRERFAARLARDLDDAVRQGLIEPCDTRLAGQVWFGAVNEVVVQWLVTPHAPPLESYYPELRRLLWRGLGVEPEREEAAGATRGNPAASSRPAARAKSRGTPTPTPTPTPARGRGGRR
jgi:AcrR family transcriptional regulator